MTKREMYEKRRRAVKLARTYVRKAEDGLHWGAHEGLAVDVEYWDLLTDMLDAARDIVSALPADYFEAKPTSNILGLPEHMVDRFHNLSDAPVERAEKLVALLAKRRDAAKRERRIAMLENVEGRTPEEAAAYLAKAAQLREEGATT